MGAAFSTGSADLLDWIYATKMLIAQGSMSIPGIAAAAASVGPGAIYIVPGNVFGGYSAVICTYPQGFSYVSILGTASVAEAAFDAISIVPTVVPYVNGLVGSTWAINAEYLGVKLRNLLQGGRPVIFCGHSLGGASAPIMAQFLKGAFKVNSTAAYSLGAPKPGTQAFADGLSVMYTRLVNYEDPIPSVPGLLNVPGGSFLAKKALAWLFGLKYTQAGTPVLLGAAPPLVPKAGILYPGMDYQINGIAAATQIAQGEYFSHLLSSYLVNLLFGQPTRANLQPGAQGYLKPWLLFGRPDPVFPPVPPAKIAPCAQAVAKIMTQTIFLVKHGTSYNNQIAEITWCPPTLPLTPASPMRSNGEGCCGSSMPPLIPTSSPCIT